MIEWFKNLFKEKKEESPEATIIVEDIRTAISNDDLAIAIAFEMVVEFEGFRATAYPDPATGARPYTIGYGTTRIDGVPVQLGMICTEEQAETWAIDELKDLLTTIKPHLLQIPTRNQLAAMLDFMYNLGDGALIKSTLLKKFNKGDKIGAANEFGRWIYANGKVMNGLVRRRKKEAELFLKY